MRSTLSNLCLILAVGSALSGCDDPRYTISGTVSGLVGDGLVLACAGVPLPIDTNGEFLIAGSFASGAEYAVTVTGQPSAPAQVCTVTGGVGVVRANVTDVAVTCVTTPLTITASTPANGATGVATDVAPTLTFSAPIDAATVSGHVTLSRGTHAVAASASATDDSVVTLTPTARLSIATPYTLTWDTSLLGSYGEAIAPSAGVTFTTRDGTWDAPVPAKVDASNAQDLSVARLSDGSFVAVWYQYDGGLANVWANTYSDGSGWGTAQTIETNNAGDSNSPRLASDAQGHAFVTWAQSNGTRTDIWGCRYTVGSGWSPAAQVSDGNVGTGTYAPAVGVNPNGDAVVTWIQTVAMDDSVWARSFPATGSAGVATRIETIAGNAYYPKVVVDASGNATVLFGNYDAGAGTVDLWASRFEGGTWGAPTAVESSTLSLSEYGIGLDGLENVFATWSQQLTGSSMGVYARRFDATTGWGATATLDTTSNSSAYTPEVAADADGNALVVWGQYVGSSLEWSSSYFTPAGGFGAKTPMTGITGPRVAFDTSGHALAVWYAEVSPTNRVVRSSRFIAEVGWAAPVLVTPGANAYAQSPVLALDPRGGALAVFTDYDVANNRSNIASSRFDDVH